MFISTDVDECADTVNPVCEQLCINYNGGYTCSCQAGYRKLGGQCFGESLDYLNSILPVTTVAAHIIVN